MPKSGSPYNEILTGRLQKISTDLREVQQLLTLEGVEPRILLEFREAVDGVRHTAWAAQQWLELQGKTEEMKNVLAVLTEHRIRVTTQMLRDLILGRKEGEWGAKTAGADKMAAAMEEMRTLLK